MAKNQKEFMRAVLFWIFVLFFCLLVIGTMVVVFFGVGSTTAEERSVLFKVFIGEVGSAVLILFFSIFGLKKTGFTSEGLQDISEDYSQAENPNKHLSQFLIKTYPTSQHPDFFSEVELLVPKAKKIILIATGLNLIWENRIIDSLIARARSGEADITICLGNPYSPHVEDRLIEEEMYGHRPPVGRDGIARSIKTLVQRMKDAGRPKCLSLYLFENYPTFATLIFDHHIYIYPYAYIRLGNVSPIFQLCNDGSEEAAFFLSNAEAVIRDAVSAEEVIEARKSKKYFKEEWIAASVYIIPQSKSKFYKWGSALLGYDIRNETIVESGSPEVICIRNYVGEAETYGFHLTLADALFFSTKAEIERLKAELRFLSEEFNPFILSGLTISDKFRREEDVVIKCDDPQGIAEVLHYELITRMYRIAISSTYRAEKTNKEIIVGKNSRADVMLSRYGSPYIMKQFEPHFTLCSHAPTDKTVRAGLIDNINAACRQADIEREIEVDEICLLVKRPQDRYWKIEEKYQLSKV